MNAAPAQRRFRAGSRADLAALLDFIDTACDPAGADIVFAVRLAVEEVFTNVLEHGYGGDGPVAVCITTDGSQVRVVLEDDAPTFDPTDAPAPDLASDALDREPGGLGWHLVRQVMDDVQHKSRGERGNTYTLVKRLPAPAP